MKAFRILLTLVIVMAAFGFVVRPAAAQLFTTYSTGTQVMNVGAATANITITYYDAGGVVGGTVNDTIASFTSKTYVPAISGSAVISSDQPLAAVTNILNAPSNATAAAAYVGASSGSQTVGIPLLFKANGTYYTWYSVQNAGAATANVVVDYSDCAGTSNATAAIPAGASHTFYQNAEACHTTAIFSAVVTSDQPIVAVVVEENPAKMLAYTGFPNGATNTVMPLINANNSGITTGVQIQNTGASNTTVTVSYTPSVAGTACTETQTINAGTSNTFALYSFNGTPQPGTTTTCIFERFVGSAQVTSNSAGMPLMAVVNQSKTTYAEAYGGFDPATATGTVVLPLIMDRNGANLYNTGISIMNVGAAATNIKCTFSGTAYTASLAAVAPNSSLVDGQGGKISQPYVGSATCKAYSDAGFTTPDPAGKLVGVVNELGKTTADRFLVYEGINIP